MKVDDADQAASLQQNHHKQQQHHNLKQELLQQQQQAGLQVPHRGRFFGTAGSTDGPGYIRDEAVSHRGGTSNKHLDDSAPMDYEENESGRQSSADVSEDDALAMGMGMLPQDLLTRPTAPVVGTLKNLMDLDPDELPCPEPVKQPPTPADDLDVDLGHEFDEANGVQTLTGTTLKSASAATAAWSACVLLCCALVGRAQQLLT